MGTRWDAVVDRNAFWCDANAAAHADVVSCASDVVQVQVLLYGGLAPAHLEQPLCIRLHAPFTIADVIREVGTRAGTSFLSRVLDHDGAKISHCRVFLDGEIADELDIPMGTSHATLEMILLIAAEGG